LEKRLEKKKQVSRDNESVSTQKTAKQNDAPEDRVFPGKPKSFSGNIEA